ncbi:MAG TPA: prephenate dehydratase domain-containing protein, partial [Vicinamibacteria bacterium]|nr:prephenate dehydratase domain-containing protein [Vicinamibacteria bacterium]
MPERATGTTSRTVAIQGERGSFSHAAVLELLGTDWMPQPNPTFDGAFQAVASGKAERALIPFENSLAGSIHENYDRLSASPLHIIGETQLRIRQCLIARPGSTLAVIRRVASHPVALAQCRTFFAEHPGVEAIATYDTAGSVMDLLRDGPATQAAIGPALA